MSELAYLGVAILVSAIGSAIVWHRYQRPQSLESGVQEFSRGLDALKAGPKAEGSRSA